MNRTLKALALVLVLAPAGAALANSSALVIRRATAPPAAGGGASCGSALISSDTFTEAGTGNIALNTHTKTTGGTWTTGGSVLGINDLSLDRANDVALSTASGTNGAGGVIDDSVTCYDYSVQASIRTGSTGTNRIGVTARYDLATGNGYWWRVTGAGDAELYADVAGSASVLIASTTVTAVVGSFAVATNYTFRLDVKGTLLTAYINGTIAPFGAVTNATYATGKPGLKMTNTNPRGDNFTVSYLP